LACNFTSVLQQFRLIQQDKIANRPFVLCMGFRNINCNKPSNFRKISVYAVEFCYQFVEWGSGV
jgi:hypothetical protein